MLTPEEQGVIEGRGVAEFRKALTEANFDGAKVIEREYMLPPQAVGSIVNATFDNFISVQRFVDAIALGKRYELPKDKISDAIYMEFRRIIVSGDIDKAIEWALLNNLPDYEITRAAIKGIEAAILGKNIELAVEIKKKYAITEDQVGSVWQKGYDEATQDGKFFEAALLSREFGMSERKTLITAVRAFKAALQQNDFDKMVLVEEEFRVFNDAGFSVLGDEESRTLIKMTEAFIKEKLRTDSFKKAVSLIQGLTVLFKAITNHTLKDLIVFIYNQGIEVNQLFLQNNRYDDAIWFVRELSLLEDNTPDKTLREIYNQGVAYHNKLLKNGNISAAIKVKKDYDLLGDHGNADSIDLIQNTCVSFLSELIEKGDTKAGNQLIKEYNIQPGEIAHIAKEAVISSLNENKYDMAIDIVTKFNVVIDDFDIKTAGRNAFDTSKRNGYYETAANIGYIFEIDSPEVREAARIVWEDLIRRQEYRKAAVIKKKHKLAKKQTENLAKEEYNRLMQENELDAAKKLREEYQINISFFAWFLELIKKILLIIFGKSVSTQPESEEAPESPETESTDTPIVK
jgi:limonene-1,2-epoxide hydrolase